MGVWPLAKVNLPHSFFSYRFVTDFICKTIVCDREVPGASVWTPIFTAPFSSSPLICSKTSLALFVWYLEINPQKGIDISGLRTATRSSVLSKMLGFLQYKEKLSYW